MLKYTVNNTLTISEALRALLSRARKGFPASWGRAWFPGSDVLLFNYARSAMKSAILGLGLQGKEIITPAFVCKELADVFAQTKTRPVFVDADPRTWNMDIRAIPKKLTKRTGAVLAVHTFGNPLPMKELLKLQKEHGFHIIEDCAQALGTRYQGKLAGSFGDAAFFSIYKMFPTISGGILVINNPRIRPPRPTHPERFGLEGLARLLYSINILYPLLSGLKPRKPSSMTPAAVIRQPPGPVQALMEHFLASAKPEINKRNALAGIYEKELKGFRLQKTEPRGWPSRISFPVCLESRDRALAEMRKAGILCDRVWHD
ncbi:MAG: DegT/DnrJ/EryC1/StrS family aminotransferase, partial [Candidatus Aenigmatarchaeota archaeon]